MQKPETIQELDIIQRMLAKSMQTVKQKMKDGALKPKP